MGALRTDYEWPLDGNGAYEWVRNSVAAIEHWAVLGATGGGPGRWILHRSDIKGDALADVAAETINIGGKPYRELASLSQDSVLTIDVVNAAAGDMIRVVSRNTALFTYTINNGGVTPSTITTFAASTPSWVLAYFNGTDWESIGGGTL